MNEKRPSTLHTVFLVIMAVLLVTGVILLIGGMLMPSFPGRPHPGHLLCAWCGVHG